ncbi:hypothetical protein LPJ63_003433 [Coemansia sp. RSA 2711]|nr:hypothetical protein LPJ63_003433 [Coemansia sp. RSA 2711]
MQKKASSKPKLSRQDQLAKMKKGRHLKRIGSLQNQGRSGGGQTQLLDARMRRARDQKSKFQQAREFVKRSSTDQHERQQAEARIQRQRSRQLKQRGTPGLGFTPARFRLLPIENEAGTDLTALSSGTSGANRTMSIKELKAQVEASTFDNMGLHPEVAAAAQKILEAQVNERFPHRENDTGVRPTEIQALGIPEILGRTRLSGQKPAQSNKETKRAGSNVFLAAETGSGKTLAYALPLLSMLKSEEEGAADIEQVRRQRRPRALVLVPSRELVAQVTATFKGLAHQVKTRVVGVHLGHARRDVRIRAEQAPIDVLVATPAAALRYLQQDPIFTPGMVQRVVVDEADSMMDQHSFGRQIEQVLDMVRTSNRTQMRDEQAVFVSATLPKLIRERIIRRFPDVVHVTTPSLHRAPQRLTQTFIDVSKDYQGHRLNALSFVLRTAATDKHLIIFCNSKAHANLVYRQLYKRGIPSLLLAGPNAERKTRSKRADVQTKTADTEPVVAAIAEGEDVSPEVDDLWEETWFAGQEDVYAAIDNAAEADSPKEAVEPVSGADVGDLEAQLPAFNRAEVLQAFMSADPIPAHLLPPVAAPAEVSDVDMGALSARRKILVCTDLGSRGLDTTCVTHVVLFDFPTTAIDYLHRAGRTARAGGRGKVTALVGKKDRRLAEQIRLAIRQGGTIH